jgi:HK97 family phage portal protein
MRLWRLWRGRKSAGLSSLDVLRELLGPPSKSGVNVTWKTAVQVTAFMCGVRVLSEGLAQMPLKPWRESADGRSHRPAKDHWTYALLTRKPNAWQTPFEFIETMMIHAVMTGAGRAFKNRMSDGRVTELLPLLPQWVTVKRQADWSLVYEVRLGPGEDGQSQTLTLRSDQVFEIRGPSWDGYKGWDVVKVAREAVGLALSTEESHARLHKNGAKVAGILSVEGELTAEQYKDLKAWVEKEFNRGESYGTMILDRGAKWTQQAMTGVDAQHLETRRFQIEEVGRALRVFPQMLMSTDKASTYASAEQFFLAHVVHSLGPWVTRWEQKLNRDLLSDTDFDAGLFCKFTVQALLRGDAKTRGQFYKDLFSVRALNPNEIRALEELGDAYAGGDEYGLPLASAAATPTDEPGAKPPKREGDDA